MLTERQLFKSAFIAKCIEGGNTTPAQVQAVAQEANIKLAGILSDISGAGKDIAGTVAGYGLPLALAAPPILGGLAGGMVGRMTDIDDTDVEEAKNQEVLEELRRQTERLRHQQTARQFAKSR